jgi:hypothetical protein
MSFSTTPDSCARHAFAITPADSNLAQEARALYVGGTGNVTVTMDSGNVVTFTNVAAGSILPISVTRVAAATTATSIIGLI